MEEEPVSPRSINQKVNRDLETICLKCLKKELVARYGSAEGLAEDLKCWRDSKPIIARPVTRRERLWKWSKRRPAAVALLAVSLVSLALVLGGGSALVYHLNDALSEVLNGREQLAKANKSLQKSTVALSDSNDRLPHLAFTSQLQRADALYKSDPQQALHVLHDFEACPIDLRDAPWRFLDRSCQTRLKGTHIGDVVSIDGERLVFGLPKVKK